MPTPEPAPEAAPIPDPRKRHPLFGKTIARCKVGERIGRGATSAVYRARYTKLDKDVALKILGVDKASDANARARFLEEAKAIAKIDHENIVRVIDVVEDQGHLCILMELVDGETVQDLLDDGGPLPPKRAVKVALDVARALAAAHEAEIVHRDIKPANFILDRRSGLVKVVDFGLASRGAANRVGTPLYMSPEAAQGKRIDDRSDVYALGVSLYQMLTGTHPFTGATVKEILASQVNGELVPASRVKRDVGTKYDEILAKMLVKAKGYRPSALEVADALEPLAGEPHRERPGAAKGQAGRRGGASGRGAKRGGGVHPTVWIGAGLAVVAGIAVLLLKDRGGDGPATPANVGPTPQAPVTPAVDPEVAAQAAFMEAESWAAANDDPAGQARRWGEVAGAHPATAWGKKAAEKKALAENAAVKRKESEAQAARDAAEKEKQEAERKRMRDEVAGRIAAWDFEGAATRANRVGPPEGVSTREWIKKGARLEFLGKEFVTRLNDGLQSTSIDATKVKATAATGERIVGATSSGLVTDAGGKAGSIPWSDVKPDALFKNVARKVTSQRRADDWLFLAILAAELGFEKDAKDCRDGVDLMDAGGEVKERIPQYFDVK